MTQTGDSHVHRKQQQDKTRQEQCGAQTWILILGTEEDMKFPKKWLNRIGNPSVMKITNLNYYQKYNIEVIVLRNQYMSVTITEMIN